MDTLVTPRPPRALPGARSVGGLRAGILAFLALILAGCSTSQLQNPFDRRAGGEQIEIEVQNLNWNEATLHVLWGSVRERLGNVPGKTDARFVVAWRQSLPLQFEIDLLASGECVTRPIQVSPGDVVVLHIEPRLDMDPDCQPRGTW